jgi:hypothetical protein
VHARATPKLPGIKYYHCHISKNPSVLKPRRPIRSNIDDLGIEDDQVGEGLNSNAPTNEQAADKHAFHLQENEWILVITEQGILFKAPEKKADCEQASVGVACSPWYHSPFPGPRTGIRNAITKRRWSCSSFFSSYVRYDRPYLQNHLPSRGLCDARGSNGGHLCLQSGPLNSLHPAITVPWTLWPCRLSPLCRSHRSRHSQHSSP